jgi:hypothetical protein
LKDGIDVAKQVVVYGKDDKKNEKKQENDILKPGYDDSERIKEKGAYGDPSIIKPQKKQKLKRGDPKLFK